MTRWSPRRVLAESGLTREDDGFTPTPLPDRIVRRVDGALNRGEAALIDRAEDGAALVLGPLRVILSTATRDDDGHVWAHLSASRSTRMPTWTELVHIRDVLLGDDVEAYQVAPPRSRYVNRHETASCTCGPISRVRCSRRSSRSPATGS